MEGLARSVSISRSRCAGSRVSIHAVGSLGVACPQQRMAQDVSHVLHNSAAASEDGPMSAAAVQGAQRLRRTASIRAAAWALPHPVGAISTHGSRIYRSAPVPIKDSTAAARAGESRTAGAMSSSTSPASAPSARITGSTPGASVSTQANRGSPRAGAATCGSDSPQSARSVADTTGEGRSMADAPCRELSDS